MATAVEPYETVQFVLIARTSPSSLLAASTSPTTQLGVLALLLGDVLRRKGIASTQRTFAEDEGTNGGNIQATAELPIYKMLRELKAATRRRATHRRLPCCASLRQTASHGGYRTLGRTRFSVSRNFARK